MCQVPYSGPDWVLPWDVLVEFYRTSHLLQHVDHPSITALGNSHAMATAAQNISARVAGVSILTNTLT